MKKTFSKLTSLLMIMTLLAGVLVFDGAAIEKNPDGDLPDAFDENQIVITYECCDGCGYREQVKYTSGAKITADKKGYCKKDGEAFVCWTSEGGEEYLVGDTLPNESVTLKAKKIPLLLKGDEVLSFSNSDPYFYTDDFSGYYMNQNDNRMMLRNINKVFLFGSPVSVGLSIALSTYPNWYWNGSCYGMSSLVFLQHHGVIDVLEGSGAASVSELENTADIVSKINYYQWAASGSFLCENFSTEKGTKMFSQQLKDMFETVSQGNIVLFTFYSGNIFNSSGHTVVLTGAYTLADGTHVLLAYDCNSPEDYISGACEGRFIISPDFTQITKTYNMPVTAWLNIGSFNWTDSYKQFDAFDIDGEGSALTWYSQFFSQIINYFKTLVKIAFI